MYIPFESSLNLAASIGCTQAVESILKSGIDVNIRNSYGETPLYLAALEGHTETVECLVQSGADLNIKSWQGKTPLHVAAWNGHTETVEYLIQSGADVNVKSWNGNTPLHIAVWNGHTETVECRLQSGADFNAEIDNGTLNVSPLHWAALGGNAQTVECLLKYGAEVNARNDLDETPLHFAALGGYSQIVKCLLKYGAYVNSKDKYGKTALHYVSGSGDGVEWKKCVVTLLEHGSDIDITNGNDLTAFDVAVNEWKKCVVTLLEHGSDIDITNGNDLTAFDVAVNDIAVYFASHILKLRVANLYVSERNIRLSDKIQTSYPANELKDQFVRELQQMRSETIFCNITFYDIFIKGISSIELYTMNENSLKGLLKSSNWKTKFSMYNTIIKSRFRNSIERKVLLELANRSFNSLFNRFAELPHECAEQILSFLSNENLKNFINASEPLHKEW
ncbi:serine/threonine-protein phosphatase 6 regulatory ankyrin repeat subunit A-like [Artemia franciscana]|uniref:serine/threonine-protein phosphatase 6 regulatory ankyrin repeat subunit A-like n=1 Tax=Artemia franciscana TaxID=6661 RepID=UPI0032DBE235